MPIPQDLLLPALSLPELLPLEPAEIVPLYQYLVGQLQEKIRALPRLQIPSVSRELWQKVPVGSVAYIASIGGTNFHFYTATKNKESALTLHCFSSISYENLSERLITFDEFIDRIIAPVANAFKGDMLRLGISLAFPHKNQVTQKGVDAEFMSLDIHGTLMKQWQITDWTLLAPQEKSFMNAIKKGLKRHKMNPKNMTITILNDTFGVALDTDASVEAARQELEVLRIGMVGGTGINFAGRMNGLINFEFGQTLLPGGMQIEMETGMYLEQRFHAGLKSLGIRPILKKSPSLLSDLATGTVRTDWAVQRMATQILQRAGQIYGVAAAAVIEVVYEGKKAPCNSAVLTEGSVLLKGAGVIAKAQETAEILGRPVTFIEASSIKGIASLAMSWPYLA